MFDMPGRVRARASGDEVGALKELARSERRDKADRARAMRVSLAGWSSLYLGAAFGARGRIRFAVAQGHKALTIEAEILSEPVENRPNATIPRLRAVFERRGGPAISPSRLRILLRKKSWSVQR